MSDESVPDKNHKASRDDGDLGDAIADLLIWIGLGVLGATCTCAILWRILP